MDNGNGREPQCSVEVFDRLTDIYDELRGFSSNLNMPYLTTSIRQNTEAIDLLTTRISMMYEQSKSSVSIKIVFLIFMLVFGLVFGIEAIKSVFSHPISM